MTDSSNIAECQQCGAVLPESYASICPECSFKKRADTVIIVIMIVSVPLGYLIAGWVGVWVGFSLELIAFLLGPKAVQQLINIVKGK